MGIPRQNEHPDPRSRLGIVRRRRGIHTQRDERGKSLRGEEGRWSAFPLGLDKRSQEWVELLRTGHGADGEQKKG